MADKLFSVAVTETSYGYVEVMASSEEEAIEKAKEEYERGNTIWNKADEEFSVENN